MVADGKAGHAVLRHVGVAGTKALCVIAERMVDHYAATVADGEVAGAFHHY